jgi:hypothetical protein
MKFRPRKMTPELTSIRLGMKILRKMKKFRVNSMKFKRSNLLRKLNRIRILTRSINLKKIQNSRKKFRRY